MLNIISYLLYSLLLIEFSEQTCDRYTGPSGAYECVLLQPYYNKYQWATCLTNEYIKLKTNNKFKCRDSFSIYCWFQCMVELHELDQGAVYDDCLCSNSNTSALSTASPLPEYCYSPDGKSCSWYKECLERRYNCQGTSADYAIRYAEKYCNLYNENYNDFDSNGKIWVDGVRKCLQVSLAPLLRPWNTYTCKEIENFAFKSHSPCYLNPGNGAPSMCKLSCSDWYRIVWTIKGAFVTPGSISASLSGMYNVALGCPANTFFCFGLPTATAALIIQYPFLALQLLYKYIKKPTLVGIREAKIDYNELSSLLTNSISSSMNWDSKQLDWLVFVDEKASNETEVVTVLWLLSRTEVNKNITVSESKILKDAQLLFEKAFTSGKLKLDFSVNGFDISCSTMHTCNDPKCNKTSSVFYASNKCGKTTLSFSLIVLTTIFFLLAAI